MDFLSPHLPPHVLDGATGTLLISRGLPPDLPTAAANLTHPDLVRDVAREYAEAGAEVITANSFAVAGPWPDGHPAARRGPELARLAIRLAREGAALASGDNPEAVVPSGAARTAERTARIAGNLGPVRPPGAPGGRDALDRIVAPLFEAMAEESPDGVLLETMVSRADAVRGTELARGAFGPGLPVLVTFAVGDDGRTPAGEHLPDAARAVEDAGADAVGVGCSAGPSSLVPAVRELVRSVGVPVLAKPSAGVPDAAGRYPVGDAEFVGAAVMLVAAGATLVGGCCGTTPATIAKLAERLCARTVPYGSH